MKPCNACGKCCIKYGDGQLSASDEDIDLWGSLRPDVASYSKGGEIWFSPETGERLTVCPWLKKVENTKIYHCEIYLDRPEDCRIYPATVADMVKDDCEMIENGDLNDLKQANIKLSQIHIADS
jgi:Fe-S-cluster containining protein